MLIKMKIELSEQKKVFGLNKQIHKILSVLGYSDALYTDESMVGDFLDISNKKIRNKQIKKLEAEVGFKIKSKDYLVEVAEKLINQEEIKCHGRTIICKKK